MQLSCPAAPPSQRELRKDCGGGGGGVARSAQSRRPGPESQVLRRIPRRVFRNALRRFLHVLVLYVSPKGRRWGQNTCVARGFRRWKMAIGKIKAFTLPSSAAPRHVFDVHLIFYII